MSTTKTIKISQGKVLDYSITKDGFKPIIGSSLITSDKSINVNMVSTESESSVYNFGDRIGGIATIVGEYTDGDGKKYAFAALDAKYRAGGVNWSTETIETGLPLYSSESLALATKESATYNTNYILSKYESSKYQSFNIARNAATIQIDNKIYNSQLPNIYELQQIFNMRNELDNLDITLSSYSSYSLSSWGFPSSNWMVLSSTEKSYKSSWMIDSSGSVTWYKWNVDYGKNSIPSGIIPVFEIEIS